MSRAARVDELLVVDDATPSRVVERIVVTMEALGRCVVTRPSADHLVVAEVGRHFLVRRTRALNVRLIREPHRVVVALLGEADPQRLVQLRAAILEPSGPVQPATFVRLADSTPEEVSPTPDWLVRARPPLDDPSQTVLRSSPLPPPSRDQSLAVGPVHLHLDDGRRIQLTVLTLIGRDPAPRADDPASERVRVDDVTVSKTHAAIGWDGHDVWIEDRESTNGSAVIDADGISVALDAGRRVRLALPSTVFLGDCRITIAR